MANMTLTHFATDVSDDAVSLVLTLKGRSADLPKGVASTKGPRGHRVVTIPNTDNDTLYIVADVIEPVNGVECDDDNAAHLTWYDDNFIKAMAAKRAAETEDEDEDTEDEESEAAETETEEVEEEQTREDELNAMSLGKASDPDTLRGVAKLAGVKSSGVKKADLVAAILAAEEAGDEEEVEEEPEPVVKAKKAKKAKEPTEPTEPKGPRRTSGQKGFSGGTILHALKRHQGAWGTCEYKVECQENGGFRVVEFTGQRDDIAVGDEYPNATAMFQVFTGRERPNNIIGRWFNKTMTKYHEAGGANPPKPKAPKAPKAAKKVAAPKAAKKAPAKKARAKKTTKKAAKK